MTLVMNDEIYALNECVNNHLVPDHFVKDSVTIVTVQCVMFSKHKMR